jgi:hypothetical protein
MHLFEKGKESKVGKFKVAIVMSNVVRLIVNKPHSIFASIVLGLFHKIFYMLGIRYVTY